MSLFIGNYLYVYFDSLNRRPCEVVFSAFVFSSASSFFLFRCVIEGWGRCGGNINEVVIRFGHLNFLML